MALVKEGCQLAWLSQEKGGHSCSRSDMERAEGLLSYAQASGRGSLIGHSQGVRAASAIAVPPISPRNQREDANVSLCFGIGPIEVRSPTEQLCKATFDGNVRPLS